MSPVLGKTYPVYPVYLARITLNMPSTRQDLPSIHPALCKTYPEYAQYLAKIHTPNMPSTRQDLPWIHPVLCKTYPEYAQYLARLTLNTPSTWQRYIPRTCPILGKTYPKEHASTWQDFPWTTCQYLPRLTLTSSTSSALQRIMTRGSSNWYSPCQQQTMWACSAYMSNNSLLHNNKETNENFLLLHLSMAPPQVVSPVVWLAADWLSPDWLSPDWLSPDWLAHTEDCPCLTGPQSLLEYVLQFWPLFREARRQQWLYGATLQEQLLGNTEDLLKATTFIKIKTKHNHHKIIRERERENK